jgi:NAD(P)-dependent dehydrogenase (short-subunit alcohol dehydrogenase family)
MRSMIAGSATGRVGTPDDIAAVVQFLTGPLSTFVTGTDLLVDGGVIASRSTGRP